MSGPSVLFDAPGPRTKRRHMIYTGIFFAVLVAVIYWVYTRLNDAGQFEPVIYERLFSNGVWIEFRRGIIGTLKAAGIAIAASVVLGFLLATARLSNHAVIRVPALIFIQFFRAVPLLLLIVFLFAWIVTVSDMERETRALVALVAGLTLYNGAVLAEIFRAGINAVPRGQGEAAYALGMRKTQVMTVILTPQAVKFMLPAIISQCVVTLKDTSLGFVITYSPELLNAASINAEFVGNLPTYVMAALLFIGLNSVLSLLATWLERRLASRGAGSSKAAAQVDDVLTAG